MMMTNNNNNTDSKFRLCQQYDETVEHISACPILAKEQYIKGHGRLISPPNLYICKETGVKLDCVYKIAINELYLVQISGLWVHMGTIKHNTSLPATSALAALVTLLRNNT